MKLERGQVAVVTGGASGLGFGLARCFAERGLDVVLGDIEGEKLSNAVGAIEAMGVSAIGVPTDVRSQSQVDALAAATLDRFGHVEIVCNNAGVSCLPAPMWEIEKNDWEWLLGVNLDGVIHGIRSFVPHLVAQDKGHVVNTASMAGISVGPGLGPYFASKHAVVALSEALSIELAPVAPNVGVTVACPGQVATDIATAERNRPDDLTVGRREMSHATLGAMIAWASSISGAETMSAEDAAEIVVAAVEANRLHVAPNGNAAGVQVWIDRLLRDLDDV